MLWYSITGTTRLVPSQQIMALWRIWGSVANKWNLPRLDIQVSSSDSYMLETPKYTHVLCMCSAVFR